MFKSVGWTWNPIVGCDHECPYKCWAMRRLSDKTPRLLVNRLGDELPSDGSWIFIGSMGDLFCWSMPEVAIDNVLDVIEDYTGTCKFLLQTKNPRRAIYFYERLRKLKDKIIIGTTIETNRELEGRAPPTIERFAAMLFFKALEFKTFLSMEPTANFDVPVMQNWISWIHPEAVEIGLENYGAYLEPPPREKLKELVEHIKSQEIPYKLKDNLLWLEKWNNG